MSRERLLASYLVRVTVRNGVRSIALHVVDRGETRRFDTYPDLLDHLERHEDGLGRSGAGAAEAPPPDRDDTEGRG